MSQTNTATPKIVIQSIGGGLLLMAFFTIMWSGIAFGNATGAGRYLILIVFSLFSLVFIGYGIYYLSTAKRFPKLTTDADKAEGKKMAKLYGITFGLEGILIPIAAGICLFLGHGELVLPAMALIIGLHFYPMAKVFNRTIDYYLASWTCLVAISVVVIIIKGILLPFSAYTFLGLGVAITTTSYGFYMMAEGSRLSKLIV
jgi:hypothetical protein